MLVSRGGRDAIKMPQSRGRCSRAGHDEPVVEGDTDSGGVEQNLTP